MITYPTTFLDDVVRWTYWLICGFAVLCFPTLSCSDSLQAFDSLSQTLIILIISQYETPGERIFLSQFVMYFYLMILFCLNIETTRGSRNWARLGVSVCVWIQVTGSISEKIKSFKFTVLLVVVGKKVPHRSVVYKSFNSSSEIKRIYGTASLCYCL